MISKSPAGDTSVATLIRRDQSYRQKWHGTRAQLPNAEGARGRQSSFCRSATHDCGRTQKRLLLGRPDVLLGSWFDSTLDCEMRSRP